MPAPGRICATICSTADNAQSNFFLPDLGGTHRPLRDPDTPATNKPLHGGTESRPRVGALSSGSRPRVRRVATDERSIIEVAAQVIGLADWLPPEARAVG